jgi:hypothetical protein
MTTPTRRRTVLLLPPALLLGCGIAVMAAAMYRASVAVGAPPAPKPKSSPAPQKASTTKKMTPLHESAKVFLSSLRPEQRAKAVLPFDAEERFNWYYVPRARQGIPLGDLDDAQQKAALALLSASLSAQGYKKVETIRSLENVLREIEGDTSGSRRNPAFYYLTFFGEPGEKSVWGWRYEGHHVSLHWTSISGKVVASSPQFLGANPAQVRRPGPLEGTRALPAEEDLGRALVKSLTPEQRAVAVLSGNALHEDRGIAYRRLGTDQQGMLLALIRQHAAAQPSEIARQRLDAIRKAGLDGIKFAWMGGLEPGQGHYYRIQGPTFLIEYDNTQNDANHVHTVWRDFKGDFGADLLREHYQAHPHGRGDGGR